MLPVREIVSSDYDTALDNSIFVIACNADLTRKLPSSFIQRIRRINGKGLLHLSDESYGGGYQIYSEFDFVIRNYHSYKFDVAGVMEIPLGYTQAVRGASGSKLTSSRRSFIWSFLGNKNGARLSMRKQFCRIEPHYEHVYDARAIGDVGKMPPGNYFQVLRNSIFCPCPMGNVNLETFRVYEALEAGCIPIVEHRLTMPYFDRLMPGNKIPSFSSWTSARKYVERLQGCPEKLDNLQQTVVNWWTNYKSSLQMGVRDFCVAGFRDSFAPTLRVNFGAASTSAHQVWRAIELSRHHSAAAAAYRIRIIAGKSCRG